jgi:hypothetical protein
MEKFILKTRESVPINNSGNGYVVAIKRSSDGKMFFLESPKYNGDLGFTENSSDAMVFDSEFLGDLFFKATRRALRGSENQAMLCTVKVVDDKISEFTFV